MIAILRVIEGLLLSAYIVPHGREYWRAGIFITPKMSIVPAVPLRHLAAKVEAA
jgi:hypothetical protein